MPHIRFEYTKYKNNPKATTMSFLSGICLSGTVLCIVLAFSAPAFLFLAIFLGVIGFVFAKQEGEYAKEERERIQEELTEQLQKFADLIKNSYTACNSKFNEEIQNKEIQDKLVNKYLDFLLYNLVIYFKNCTDEKTAFEPINIILTILEIDEEKRNSRIASLKSKYIYFTKYFYDNRIGEYIKDYTSEIIRDNDGNICAMTLLELVGIQIDDFTENFVPALKNLRI